MDNFTASGNWVTDYELPSANESKAGFEADEVDDGTYQFQITDISPRLDNKFDVDKDRRALTLVIVKDLSGDDPDVVGKRIKQYMNVSSNPKSAMYPYFKAAAGGNLDPNVRPRLIDLKDAQIRGTLVTKMKESGEGETQVLQGIMPAKSRVDPVPF